MPPNPHSQIYVIESNEGTVLKAYTEYLAAYQWVNNHGGYLHTIPLVICKPTTKRSVYARDRKQDVKKTSNQIG